MTAAEVPVDSIVPAADRFGWRGRVAATISRNAMRQVPVRMTVAGRTWGTTDPSAPELVVAAPRAFFARLGRDPKAGLGEAYMAGDWHAGPGTDLADLLAPFARRLTRLVPAPLARWRGLVDRALPADTENTPDGSRRNIEAHYDLSNDLFTRFLDPTMSYSAAMFDSPTESLESAQVRKLDHALDLAGVGSGSRMLEIGCGWGSLALRAAARGASVLAITLSRQQLAFAQQRAAQHRHGGPVEFRLSDYRDLDPASDGTFDAIVSIEMIEAVGEAYWPTYVGTLDRMLTPDGAVVIQAITMAHDRMLATRHSHGWIQKYIFPGGLIPSREALASVFSEHTGIRITDSVEFGPAYAETLRRWRHDFTKNWPQISRHGFDQTFQRMWEFYLAYCEAGFRVGYLDVCQLRATQSFAAHRAGLRSICA